MRQREAAPAELLAQRPAKEGDEKYDRDQMPFLAEKCETRDISPQRHIDADGNQINQARKKQGDQPPAPTHAPAQKTLPQILQARLAAGGGDDNHARNGWPKDEKPASADIPRKPADQNCQQYKSNKRMPIQ